MVVIANNDWWCECFHPFGTYKNQEIIVRKLHNCHERFASLEAVVEIVCAKNAGKKKIAKIH